MTIKIGVGLNTGACCVGNLGSEQRFSYSAIGDSVNVAARVEGLTKQYGLPILITENTSVHASGLALLEIDLVRVVGRAEPIGDLHLARRRSLRGVAGIHRRLFAAHSAHDRDLPLGRFRAGRRGRGDGAEDRARSRSARLYDVYAKRIAALRENPPPEPWDGVFTALEK